MSALWLLVTVLFVRTLCAQVHKTEDGIKIKTVINLEKNCTSDEGIFAFLLGLSVEQCVQECGLRKHCVGLNYKWRANVCVLLSSEGNVVLNTSGCIHVRAADIEVIQVNIELKFENSFYNSKPCIECAYGERCDINTRQCIFKECLATVKNGRMLGNVFTIGAVTRYKCNGGYTEASGVRYATCLQSGQWSAVPDCQIVCGDLPLVKNGQTSLDTNSGNSVLQSASVTCDAGYNSSVDTISCTKSGSWETATCDPIICGDLPLVKNGQTSLDTKRGNSVLQSASVTCDAGYMSTVDTISCTKSGSWETATCDPITCVDPPSIEHGTAVPDNDLISFYLDTATVNCEPLYKASANKVTCTATGIWEKATCYDCYIGSSIEYTGKKNVTESGAQCQRWDSQTPRKHKLTNIDAYPDSSFSEAKNYCRNPDYYPHGLWCYTVDLSKHRWELCGIQEC